MGSKKTPPEEAKKSTPPEERTAMESFARAPIGKDSDLVETRGPVLKALISKNPSYKRGENGTEPSPLLDTQKILPVLSDQEKEQLSIPIVPFPSGEIQKYQHLIRMVTGFEEGTVLITPEQADKLPQKERRGLKIFVRNILLTTPNPGIEGSADQKILDFKKHNFASNYRKFPKAYKKATARRGADTGGSHPDYYESKKAYFKRVIIKDGVLVGGEASSSSMRGVEPALTTIRKWAMAIHAHLTGTSVPEIDFREGTSEGEQQKLIQGLTGEAKRYVVGQKNRSSTGKEMKRESPVSVSFPNEEIEEFWSEIQQIAGFDHQSLQLIKLAEAKKLKGKSRMELVMLLSNLLFSVPSPHPGGIDMNPEWFNFRHTKMRSKSDKGFYKDYKDVSGGEAPKITGGGTREQFYSSRTRGRKTKIIETHRKAIKILRKWAFSLLHGLLGTHLPPLYLQAEFEWMEPIIKAQLTLEAARHAKLKVVQLFPLKRYVQLYQEKIELEATVASLIQTAKGKVKKKGPQTDIAAMGKKVVAAQAAVEQVPLLQQQVLQLKQQLEEAQLIVEGLARKNKEQHQKLLLMELALQNKEIQQKPAPIISIPTEHQNTHQKAQQQIEELEKRLKSISGELESMRIQVKSVLEGATKECEAIKEGITKLKAGE